MSDDGTAFTLLGNEVRLRIVEALGDLSDPGEFSTLSFSALQDAVGVDDNGTFNYHLGKLVGEFVERTDEGYQLLLPGIYVYRALRSASGYTARTEHLSIDLPCLECGTDLVAWIEDGRGHVGCDECGDVDTRYPVPAGGIQHALEVGDGEAVALALGRRITLDTVTMLHGFCPYCSGPTTTALTKTTDWLPRPENARSGVVVNMVCEYCHWFTHANLEGALASHPRVVPFLQRNDVDPYRMDATRHFDNEIEIHTTDPWRIDVEITCREERLSLSLDGELSVRSESTDSGGPPE